MWITQYTAEVKNWNMKEMCNNVGNVAAGKIRINSNLHFAESTEEYKITRWESIWEAVIKSSLQTFVGDVE